VCGALAAHKLGGCEMSTDTASKESSNEPLPSGADAQPPPATQSPSPVAASPKKVDRVETPRGGIQLDNLYTPPTSPRSQVPPLHSAPIALATQEDINLLRRRCVLAAVGNGCCGE
jgi:hypothetical protein